MKIILLSDVAKVGKKQDVKEVSDGYALNFLIPKRLAITATSQAIKQVELEKVKIEGEKKIQEELLAKNLKSLENTVVTIVGKANAKGHLFAGIHAQEIAKELEAETRIKIDPSFIVLPEAIKTIGEHSIEVKVGERSVRFKLNVCHSREGGNPE